MTVLANPIVSTRNLRTHSFHGFSLKPVDQFLLNGSTSGITLLPIHQRKANLSAHRRTLTVQAAYSDGGKSSGASIFIGGFVLGGIVVGTLGCVYAPQISKALAGADRKDLMRKLPKFIYDEEKALEKTRKILTEKIAQLNSAIDDVSSQLHADDAPNGVAVASDEIEAVI
ncbi:uncharacterized protein LOC122084024 [Macadamia integrifolia]|uniref:uncharacterized protein LOC122084024 n=1 Tax=Macadamia integrifolia TaxID=60698 RepID=UPI001C4E86D0|nr:uncharacterized protein LOC122084024 [Macadamia integrifolia]